VEFIDSVPEEYTGRPEAYWLGALLASPSILPGHFARPPGTNQPNPKSRSEPHFEERVTRAPPEDVSATGIADGD